MPVALITGGSTGLGLALATTLADRGWTLIIDARGAPALQAAAKALGPRTVAIAGDVADPQHRQALIDAVNSVCSVGSVDAGSVDAVGRLDLLVNNAGGLGPSPLPALSHYPLGELEALYRVNVLAPLALIQLGLPLLRRAGGTIVNLSSDAAVEAYPGWGGYGSTKAALDQLTAVLAVELANVAGQADPAPPGKPGRLGDPADPAGQVRVYGFDPGDLRTAMHQAAFPGEDISDRPEPATVVPALLRLIDERPAGGRYRATDLLTQAIATPTTGTATAGTGAAR